MKESMIDRDIVKVLYTEQQIKARVDELGKQIYEEFKDKDPLFLGVLRGCFVFMADLIRACPLKCDVEFVAVSSYRNGTTSSGAVEITRDIKQDITGRSIIVVEDILDTGNTLYFLKKYILSKGAASVTVATLFEKPDRLSRQIKAEYSGFEVPNEFIVGYGLDYAQKYRNLPYIGVLKPEIYKS